MKPTIYIVEDDHAVRQSLVWLLRSESLNVEAFERPSELLRASHRLRYGCLILDLMLPEMDAMTLHQQLVGQNCLLPFLVITGHGEVPDACHAMRDGAVDFIEKPVSRDVLLERINFALRKCDEVRGQLAELEALSQFLTSLPERFQERLKNLGGSLVNYLVAADPKVQSRRQPPGIPYSLLKRSCLHPMLRSEE